MKHFITAVLTAFSLCMATITVQAQELETDTESAMMLYYSMPFDGKSRTQEIPTYGFRLDTLNDETETFSGFTGKPAMMDFAVNEDGAQALRFNGDDAPVKKTVYNADAGASETFTSLDWGIVAAGVVGVAVLIKKDEKEDKPDVCPVVTFRAELGFVLNDMPGPCDQFR